MTLNFLDAVSVKHGATGESHGYLTRNSIVFAVKNVVIGDGLAFASSSF
jgi:hypothetical protein